MALSMDSMVEWWKHVCFFPAQNLELWTYTQPWRGGDIGDIESRIAHISPQQTWAEKGLGRARFFFGFCSDLFKVADMYYMQGTYSIEQMENS